MIYRIEKEDFRLDLELDKWCDDKGEINADLTIRVGCEGFYGSATVDFVGEDFHIFLEELKKLKDTLTGKAELKEPYSWEPFLTFEILVREPQFETQSLERDRARLSQGALLSRRSEPLKLPMALPPL